MGIYFFCVSVGTPGGAEDRSAKCCSVLSAPRETLARLLTYFNQRLLSRDQFVSYHYQSRREFHRACETAGKSGKQIERCVIASFRIGESMGFKGDFRQWEHLLRNGE